MSNPKKIAKTNFDDMHGDCQEKVEGVGVVFKMLPHTIRPKGTGIPGLTATLHKRTKKVAWYIRNDGYHEVFYIKTGKAFDKTGMMEYYPGTNDFGNTAWCIRSEEDAVRYYANLCLGQPVNERTVSEENIDTTSHKNRRIRGSLP